LPLIATVSTDHPSIDSQKDRPCTYNKARRRIRVTRFFRVKPASVQHYVCVSILVVFTRHEKGLRLFISSVVCLALPHSPHYIIKGAIFGKKLLNIFFISSTDFPETLLILRRIRQSTGRFIMYSAFTKIYYKKNRRTHIYETCTDRRNNSKLFSPNKLFFILVHISAARRCECM